MVVLEDYLTTIYLGPIPPLDCHHDCWRLYKICYYNTL